MVRQIFLDTETTGLEPRLGHRIIEIAGVELIDRHLTGRHFHCYLNPEREIDAGAEAVHGLSIAFLQDKPHFAEVVDELLVFIGDDELVIHNAPFDLGFINHELTLAGRHLITGRNPVLDTLKLARDLHPGQKNNLDALCRRYDVDNANRTLHGALLDAELLAAVYLAMTRGQESLMMSMEPDENAMQVPASYIEFDIKVLITNEQELAAHQAVLTDISKQSKNACLWTAVAIVAPSGL